MMRPAQALERRLSVRARSTLLASVVVAVALLVGSLILLWIYSTQLVARLDERLEQGALQRAQLLDEGSDPAAVVIPVQGEAMVWIGHPDGTTVVTDGPVVPFSSPIPETIGETTELYLLANARSVEEAREHGPGGEDEQESEEHDGEGEEHEDDEGGENAGEVDDEAGGPATIELRVASAATGDGSTVVAVGAQVTEATGAVGPLAQLFLVGLPPLVGLVAWLTWSTAGRALSPVERIRSRASEISGANLDERVPVPEARDEIHDLAETVNAMLTRIEAHDRSLRQFTADASHELKSPVANLRTLVETAAVNDPGWAPVRSALTAESDRLRDRVENLLYLAAHDAGRPRPSPTRVSVDELLFREAEVVAATSTSVSVDMGGVEPAVVEGVETDLSRLVRNLVDNAVRHAEQRIALSVTLDGDRVDLVVADDGAGVPVAERERIFERFTRLDPSRNRSDGGAGLGLAIVRGIAEEHGATVTVGDSALGGAEFRVSFPNSSP